MPIWSLSWVPEELEAYERAGRKLSENLKDGSADRTGVRNGALGEKGMARL